VSPVVNGRKTEVAVVSFMDLEGRHVDEKDNPTGRVGGAERPIEVGSLANVFSETAIDEDEMLLSVASVALTMRLETYPGAGNVTTGRNRYVVVSTAAMMSENIDRVATLRDAFWDTD